MGPALLHHHFAGVAGNAQNGAVGTNRPGVILVRSLCRVIVFERRQRAALDRMADRLLDLNRNIGRPDKLSTATASPKPTVAV